VVSRTIEVYDNDFMTVAAGSPSMSPGSTIINNSDTPNGTIFTFAGGSPVVVTLDDTGADPDVFADDDYTHHIIADGGGLVATGTGVESESLFFIRALDEFGNPTGPTITITVFSQGNNTSDIWAFHSDTPLIADAQYVKTSGKNFGAASYSSLSSQPVCYAFGTLIDTPNGPRAIETLHPGELVATVDHGPQAIRWIQVEVQPLEATEVASKPVLIAAGALGGKLPAQDLIVSPQHRILVGGHGQLQGLFQTEALAPAKSLTALKGIRHMKGKTQITWIHFACERHEIVTANGCLAEALLLGPMVITAMAVPERQAVIDLFGPALTPDAALNGPPARQCLKAGSARRQIVKSLEEKRQLVTKETRKWDLDLAMEQYDAELMREAKASDLSGMKNVA